MGRFSGTDQNRPARQFLFQIPGNRGRISRNNQIAVLDLVGDSRFF